MKAARLIVLGVALAAGGIAAYLASGSRQPEPKAPEPPPPPLATVDVLIAETDLNTKTDKLSEKVDLGFNRLGDKMDKLSDDTHRLMGRADAIRGVNP